MDVVKMQHGTFGISSPYSRPSKTSKLPFTLLQRSCSTLETTMMRFIKFRILKEIGVQRPEEFTLI